MPNWIKPFHDSNDQEYHYFSIEDITGDVRITQQSYDAGLSLIQSGDARLSKASFDYDKFYNTREMIGRISVSIKPNQSIAVSFTKEMLLDCRCNSYKCRQMHDRSANGICQHEAAALILMTDHLVKNHPGDSTDRTASAFLKQFRRSHRTEKQQKSGTVHLIPRLILDDEDISIRLLISSDSVRKPYVVKNIADLFQDIDAGRAYPLGKNAEINFSEEDFAEDTYIFAQTIRGWLHDKKESRRDRYYYHSDDDLKLYIRLYGDRLDRFFDLFLDRELELYQSKTHKMKLTTGNPKVKLHIKKLVNSRSFEGVIVSGQIPSFYYGNQHDYCISGNCLYRMEADFADELSPLMSLHSDHDGKIQFQIGRKNLSEFYYTVLPELRRIAEIIEDDSDEIETFLPPEVAFKFYLDVDDGRPECRIGTWYGETGVAIFDLLDKNSVIQDFRDVHREREVLDFVMQYFPKFRKAEERFLGSDDEDVMYEIMETAVPRLTPIENRLSELWSIFDYLMPGLLYGYDTFKDEFETPIVRHSDESATKKLRRMTSVFILRRLKKDVLRDLPDKLEENYVVRFDEKQRHIYDAKVLELRQLLQGANAAEFQTIKLKVFSYLTQIRQICCDPGLLLSDYDGGSVKRDACMEIVQRAIEGEHRVLIFSQFTTMLEKLEQDLKNAGIAYYKIIGETSKKKRMELVESFNSGNTPVLLISLKAGGTG